MAATSSWMALAQLLVGAAFAFSCLFFLWKAFSDDRPPTPLRYDIVHLVCSLCAGASGLFFAGAVLLSADIPMSGGGRLIVQGVSGAILFILVFLRFSRKYAAQAAVAADTSAALRQLPGILDEVKRHAGPLESLPTSGPLSSTVSVLLTGLAAAYFFVIELLSGDAARRVIMWILGLVLGGLLALWAVRWSEPRLDQRVVACARETGQTLESTLRAETWWYDAKKLDIQAELKRQSSVGDTPKEAQEAKQRFFLLACVDRKLADEASPRWAESCTVDSPCVDIVRFADFTRSHCANPKGEPPVERRDYVRLVDHVTVYPPEAVNYEGKAQPDGGAKLEVVRIVGGQTHAVGIASSSCPKSNEPCRYPELTYLIPLTQGQAEYEWQWTDGHGGAKQDGLVVTSLARVHSVRAQVLLPRGVNIPHSEIAPATVAAKCIPGWNSILCRELTGSDKSRFVKWEWQWNMWSRCELGNTTPSPGVTSSAALPRADIASAADSAQKPAK